MRPFNSKCIFSFILAGILCIIITKAETPDIQKARNEAAAFFASELKSSHEVVLYPRYQSPLGVSTPVFAFQKEDEGYVVIAKFGDNYVVAGYSEDGLLDAENTPEAFWLLLQSYEQMDSIAPPALKTLKSSGVVVSPLLASRGVNLGQTYHTNAGGCPSGCAATAMAQIMAYHRHPDQPTGAHCYVHPNQGEHCVDFSEIQFDWNNMNNTNLQYYIGVSMEMNFCGSPYGSFPERSDFFNVMEDYFGYFLHTQGMGSDYWKYELDNGRPFYASMQGERSGHAVVIDGYDSDDYFHIHFGWAGLSNGFFLLNNENLIAAGSDRYRSRFSRTVFISPNHYVTNEQDSLALVAIHNSLNGQTGWDLSKPVVKWHGVNVMNERVMRVQIGSFGSNISGTIPPQIGQLTELRSLILNADINDIPEEIGLLSELTYLRLNGNINGTLPASITNLNKLQGLSIQRGQGNLTWQIPSDIDRMSSLTELYLPDIAVGTLPESFGQLSQLRTAYLYQGALTGQIPSSIGNLGNLENIQLARNQLTGTIPTSIGNLTNLVYLDLSENELSGSLPEGLGQLQRLYRLNLQNNDFSGTLPEQLNWYDLVDLQLHNNQLEGEIPSSIGNSKNLQGLRLHNNNFSEFPDEIGELIALTHIDVSENQLTSLPESLMNIPGLLRFKAANNHIAELPDNFGAWENLIELNLSNNRIETFPVEICFLTNLETVDLSHNKIKRLPSAITMLTPKNHLLLAHNEISGSISRSLLNVPLFALTLSRNRLTFDDLPAPEKLRHGIGDQKSALLSVNEIKAKMGDTLYIDIRDLGNFSNPDNEYFWLIYPDKISARFKNELDNQESDPVLVLPVNEETLSRQYYCKIFNFNVPEYDRDHMGSISTLPALRFLNTDTIGITLYTEQELVEKAYPDRYVTESKKLHNHLVYDNNVTLLAPAGLRGEVTWQGSLDGQKWHTISEEMEQENIKVNVVDFNEQELVISAQSPAWFRSAITEESCDPIYTDSVRVKPLGNLLFDEMVNVAEESLTISVDSIEVTLPVGLTDKDFRLTITKLDNPPPTPDMHRLSSVYDVTVSFGTVFDIPLEIKLKNIDITDVDAMNLPDFRPVYYDDQAQEWVEYLEGGISLEDDAVVFYTPHLTKLGWWEVRHGSYTHRFTKNRAEVIYKWDTGTGEINSFMGYEMTARQSPSKPWHQSNTDPDTGGTPLMIQDVAEYLNQVIDSFAVRGLNLWRSRFIVYVSNTGSGSFGHISAGGYARGYFTLNSQLLIETDDLKRTIAHEYMHYMQQFYMAVMTANTFWAEANAPLAGRLVWGVSDLENAEPEVNLQQSYKPVGGDKSIFDLLGQSWDAATFLPVLEKFTANQADANLSSTFLHYMHQYREGTKLNPVKMLTDLHTFGSLSSIIWRNYLNDQIVAQLGSTVGQEYDDYVRYMLEGSNPKLTILNKGKGNPLSHIINNTKDEEMGTFAQNMIYHFNKDENDPQVDDISFAVPYLASKMIVMSNSTPDRAVVVNYTRKHDLNPDGKVYYGKYDFESEKMVFEEISDSTKFSMLLEPNSQFSAKRYQNMGFLLFVNQRCPSVIGISNNFNTSFELEAMPVINIYNIADARITDRSIHQYSDGRSRSFIIDGNINIPNAPGRNHTTTNYNSRKRMLNDSAYVVYSGFTERLVVDNGQNSPTSITTWNKEQVITYNFVKGTLEIQQSILTTYRWGGYSLPQPNSDVYMPAYTHTIRNETKRLKLKNVTSFEEGQYPGYYGDVLEFKTSNTNETMQAVEEIYHTFTETRYDSEGDVVSSDSATYTGTDFSSPDITVEVKVHNKRVFFAN
ncbi:leucine-rich repeat domain-containing protein [Alkalitalea saponilacus]|uniref:Leucine-rich repeat (LRR) protein n=1 Tax=Alkalitalea saponilacus TaxID=889453 RepID=A0A1T5GV38_9BACT|nr:C10 family peptidase [Alkalitalea saponilacus]ASB48180.1 hypothetical protein CDL62_02980 [Alkalitalea saponilacus]SKC12265.1 Leucine-rich repeat (LRR) protein [Alkalitalea saponilacus]